MIPLLDKHWSETEPNQDTIKLDPDWKEYAKLDAAGILHIFTARDESGLVGYCVVMISKSMHHKGHVLLMCYTLNRTTGKAVQARSL